MATLAIISFLLGAVIGTRFSVRVLLPLSLFVGLNTLFVTLIGNTLATACLSGFVVIIALQGGYLFGSLTRLTVAAARTEGAEEARAPVRLQES
jgi:hypothetical protein